MRKGRDAENAGDYMKCIIDIWNADEYGVVDKRSTNYNNIK